MGETKTKATGASVDSYLASRACLYFKRLADLEVRVLEALMAGSVAEVRRRYPPPATPNPRRGPVKANAGRLD